MQDEAEQNDEGITVNEVKDGGNFVNEPVLEVINHNVTIHKPLYEEHGQERVGPMIGSVKETAKDADSGISHPVLENTTQYEMDIATNKPVLEQFNIKDSTMSEHLLETKNKELDIGTRPPILVGNNQGIEYPTMSEPLQEEKNNDVVDIATHQTLLEKKYLDKNDLTMCGHVLEVKTKEVDISTNPPILEGNNQGMECPTMSEPGEEEKNNDVVDIATHQTSLEKKHLDKNDLTMSGHVLEVKTKEVDISTKPPILEGNNQGMEYPTMSEPGEEEKNNDVVDIATHQTSLEKKHLDKNDLTMSEHALKEKTKGVDKATSQTVLEKQKLETDNTVQKELGLIGSKNVFDTNNIEDNVTVLHGSEKNIETIDMSKEESKQEKKEELWKKISNTVKTDIGANVMVNNDNDDIFEAESAEILLETAMILDTLESEAKVTDEVDKGLKKIITEDDISNENKSEKVKKHEANESVIVLNDETEVDNTIVLDDDDDDEISVIEPIVIDDDPKDNDCSIVEVTSTETQFDTHEPLIDAESKAKFVVEEYNEILRDCPTLIELIEICLSMENTIGMIRIIKRILIKIYKSLDNAYMKSVEFRLLIMKTISHLHIEPELKFSHVKNLCEEMKQHKEKKRVSLVTLPYKRRKEKPHLRSKRKKVAHPTFFIDLDDEDEEEDPNNIESNGNQIEYAIQSGGEINLDSNVNVPQINGGIVLTNNSTECPDTDNIQIHKEQLIEIEDSSSDVIIGDGNNSDGEIMLNDNSNKENTIQHVKKNTINNIEIKKLVVNISATDQSNIQNYQALKRKQNGDICENPRPIESVMDDESKRCSIMFFEQNIARLKKQIDALDLLEETEHFSPYVESEKLKLTVLRQYKELCILTGTDTVKRHKVRLHIVPGHAVGPVRCLEDFLNFHIDEEGNPPFPDLEDVVDCVYRANTIYDMNWNRQQIMAEARALFSHYGRSMQKRRQQREYKDLLSLVKEQAPDPADSDAALQARLAHNDRIARKNEHDLLERFSQMESGRIDPDLDSRVSLGSPDATESGLIQHAAPASWHNPETSDDNELENECPGANSKDKEILEISDSVRNANGNEARNTKDGCEQMITDAHGVRTQNNEAQSQNVVVSAQNTVANVVFGSQNNMAVPSIYVGNTQNCVVNPQNIVASALNTVANPQIVMVRSQNNMADPPIFVGSTQNYVVNPQNTVASGQNYVVNPQYTVARGQNYVVNPQNTVASGQNYVVNPQYTVARGQNYVVNPQNTVACGQNYAVNPQYTVARGQNYMVNSQNTVASGQNYVVNPQNTVACGQNYAVNPQYTVARGQNYVVNPQSIVANAQNFTETPNFLLAGAQNLERYILIGQIELPQNLLTNSDCLGAQNKNVTNARNVVSSQNATSLNCETSNHHTTKIGNWNVMSETGCMTINPIKDTTSQSFISAYKDFAGSVNCGLHNLSNFLKKKKDRKTCQRSTKNGNYQSNEIVEPAREIEVFTHKNKNNETRNNITTSGMVCSGNLHVDLNNLEVMIENNINIENVDSPQIDLDDIKTEPVNVSLLESNGNTSKKISSTNTNEIKTGSNQEKVDSAICSNLASPRTTVSPRDNSRSLELTSNNFKEIETESGNVSTIKREPLDIPSMLESLGDNFTSTIFDIEDPFMVVDISDSSDSEDEHS